MTCPSLAKAALRLLSPILVACGTLVPAAAQAARPVAPPSTRIVLPPNVVPLEYRIEFTPDAAASTFEGSVEIDLRVLKATSRIVLNSAGLVIEHAALSGERGAPAISYDKATETAAFTFGHRIPPGRRTLTLAYRGRIADHAAGLFALKYDTPQGVRSALYTQFENSDARRFVPCWDEPARKAVFRLGATIPAAEVAVGNMPLASSETRPGERLHVSFAPTPPMSSYLLFFALGDFERVHRDVGGVDVGVVVKRGDLERAHEALEVAAQILPYYDDYFGTRYPLPKLDLVAGPGSSGQFGAMENWGAIFLFERFVLVDPKLSTSSDKQDVFSIIAHEMAHQWFGNLVTMQWWDDIWLNEGFAEWMQTKAAEHFHPEWKAWSQTLGYKQHVMGIDARTGTHPVVMPIDDVLQAAGTFDSITYGKGLQVIRTLEAYVGEAAFRDGVRRYMARHAYGNTVSDDFWRALDAHAARPIAAIAHELTLQAGVPMITALSTRCDNGRTTVMLAQDHFAIDADSTPARRWHVPVTIAAPGGASARAVIAGDAPQAMTLPGCEPVIVNAGQTAYFRTRYPDASLAALLARYASLPLDDQLGLFNDTDSLAMRGLMPMSALLELDARIPPGADPLLGTALATQFKDIDRLYEDLPAQLPWRAFAAPRLNALLAAIGTRKAPGESANVTQLRADVSGVLGRMDDANLIADARAEFARFVANPDARLDPELREFMLQTVAAHADAPTWETLHQLARAAPTEVEKQRFYDLLCTTKDAALAARALELALSGEPPTTQATRMIEGVSALHPALAFDFTLAHWDRIEPRLEQGGLSEFVPGLVGNAPDLELVARLEAFGAAHIPANARLALERAEARMRYRARIRQERLPEIDRWLAAGHS